jgi:hypothetical protein
MIAARMIPSGGIFFRKVFCHPNHSDRPDLAESEAEIVAIF